MADTAKAAAAVVCCFLLLGKCEGDPVTGAKVAAGGAAIGAGVAGGAAVGAAARGVGKGIERRVTDGVSGRNKQRPNGPSVQSARST